MRLVASKSGTRSHFWATAGVASRHRKSRIYANVIVDSNSAISKDIFVLVFNCKASALVEDEANQGSELEFIEWLVWPVGSCHWYVEVLSTECTVEDHSRNSEGPSLELLYKISARSL
jgi:hypothetical protein